MLMEWFVLIEHDEQSLSEKGVRKPEKGRSAEEKIGRIKYNQVLLKRVLAEIGELRGEMRVIRNALENAEFMRFSVPDVQKFAFADKVDEEIFDLVKTRGSNGMFPKDVAADLQEYSLKYYDVSRRIVRVNKRLKRETGELLFEKRGHKWALTRFAFDVYGAGESEISGVSGVVDSEEGREE
jgi:hypothetical protein